MAISGKCSAVGKIELDPVVFVQRRPPEITEASMSEMKKPVRDCSPKCWNELPRGLGFQL
jgi:hypothetical protein